MNMKLCKIIYIIANAAIVSAYSMNSWALDEGTTIIGTKEAPNVLNVVPWQAKELAVDPWKSKPNFQSQLLDDSLKPVDRDELRRQVEYFNLLQHSPTQAVDQ